MSKIHYTMLLDDSGSMTGYKRVTAQGVNQVLAALKNVANETKTDIRITIAGFGSGGPAGTTAIYSKAYDDVKVQNIKPFPLNYDFQVGGGTELYHGMGTVLDFLKKRVNKKDKVVLNIFTDGGTSDSAEPYNKNGIKKMVSDAVATKQYTISFIAANQEAREVAKHLNIPQSNAMDYQQSISGTRSVFYQLAKAARQYVEKVVENWHDDFSEDFFPEVDLKDTVLKVKDIEVLVNMPESLKTEDETENELPPYAPVKAHVVDEYPACPENWEHGSSKASSYFIPVKENHGCWFDFNKLSEHAHDISVVVSVQGVNPVTGQKTSELCLEKYENKCPLHDEEFGQERFCNKCGFKWPAQNYLATTGQPQGQMWLDGFRAKDGKVRQYVFTAEEMKGVAFHVLGDKDKPKHEQERVHAVGFAFYRSKNAKPKPIVEPTLSFYQDGMGAAAGAAVAPSAYFSPLHTPQNWQVNSTNTVGTCGYSGASGISGFSGYRGYSGSSGFSGVSGTSGFSGSSSHIPDKPIIRGLCSYANMVSDTEKEMVIAQAMNTDEGIDALQNAMAEPIRRSMEYTQSSLNNRVAKAAAIRASLTPKNYEVGAGARIDQRVHDDPQKMDYWEETPYAFMYINYTDEDTAEKILAAGKRMEVEEGFLAEVPVGN